MENLEFLVGVCFVVLLKSQIDLWLIIVRDNVNFVREFFRNKNPAAHRGAKTAHWCCKCPTPWHSGGTRVQQARKNPSSNFELIFGMVVKKNERD